MILLTNDDGIDSEGLLSVKQAVSRLDDVVVIAPNHNWSAAGHTKTMHRPLRVARVRLRDGAYGFSSDGTPSDCVALAFLGFTEQRPSLVVSGINKGPNLGSDITYSGTVAAAMEGVVNGVPSMAVSLDSFHEWDFSYAAEFAARLAENTIRNGLSGDVLLNVNIPNLPKERITGVEITRLGKRVYRDALIKRTDPYGRDYYWIGGEEPTGEPEEGTDVGALARGRISITPIQLDLTSHTLIRKLVRWRLTP